MTSGTFADRYAKDTVDAYWELTKASAGGMLLLAALAVLAAVARPKTDGSDTPAWSVVGVTSVVVLLLILRAARQFVLFRRLAARDRLAGSRT